MDINAASIAELLALIFAIINHHKIKNTILWWFIPFLVLTNIIEFGIQFGNVLKLFTLYGNNWIFNIFNPIEFCFYGWLYFKILQGSKEKWVIVITIITLLLAVVINLSFFQGFKYLNTYTYMLGSVNIVIYVYLYFRQLLNDVDADDILKKSYFWISVGICLCYTGQFFLMAFFQYFLVTNNFSSYYPVFIFFNILVNVLLYSCISIAFFCKPTPQNIL